MTQKQNEIVVKLQERIPVQNKYGLELLEKSGWNIDKAESIFKNEQIDFLAKKENVENELAKKHLENNKFNFSKAIQSIRNEKYPLTERIFKFNKDKEDILSKVALAIEESENLKRDFWIIDSELNKLNPSQYTFMIIWEWQCYEGWEDFTNAICLNKTDHVIEQIKVTLKMDTLSDLIRKAKTRKKVFEENYPEAINTTNYSDFINSLNSDKEYSSYSAGFCEKRPELIDKLVEFVQNHINEFPK